MQTTSPKPPTGSSRRGGLLPMKALSLAALLTAVLFVVSGWLAWSSWMQMRSMESQLSGASASLFDRALEQKRLQTLLVFVALCVAAPVLVMAWARVGRVLRQEAERFEEAERVRVETEAADRKLVAGQLHLLRDMTLAITSAEDLQSALQVVLKMVCEATGWVFGQAWLPHGSELRCTPAWHATAPGLEKFRTDSETKVYQPGQGLPGEVWKEQKAVWLRDLASSALFTRLATAQSLGFKTGVGIPVLLNREVVAVMEFFMFEPREADFELVNFISGIAAQVGSLIQRKRAEEALARERNNFNALLENVPVRIYFKDTESRFLRGSRSLLQRFGVKEQQELEGRTDFDFFPEVQAREFFEDDRRVLATGQPLLNKIEKQVESGGKVSWALVTKVPMFDGEGAVSGLIGMSRDITELKETEEELRRQQTFFNSVVENLPITVFIKDARDLRFVLWNRAGEELSGYSHEEFLGKNDYDFYPKAEADFFTAKDRETLSTRQLTDIPEEVNHTRYKGIRILHTRKIPILDETGEPRYLLGMSEDVTEQRRAEEKMRAFAAQLEQNNRELQDFAYVASHDLQEPLRKVRAFGDRLRARFGAGLGEEGLDYLERMQNAARRMQRLIDDLLSYSRITTKAQPFVPVNLGTIAREVVSDLEVRTEQSEGRVELGELPEIDADEVQMRQLLQNLIGNALKYHRPGVPPVVTVSAEWPKTAAELTGRTALNRACRIFVQDNGIGFDEKYLDRIFVVFQRLHGRGQFEGTGVGLAICRKIVVRHGGDITARSRPGEGSTFIVTLPMKHQRTEAIP